MNKISLFLLCFIVSFLSKGQELPSEFGNKVFELIHKNKLSKLENLYANKQKLFDYSEEVFVNQPQKLENIRIARGKDNWNEKKEDFFNSFRKEFKRLDENYLSQAQLDSITYVYEIISPEGEEEIIWPSAKEYNLSNAVIIRANVYLHFHINKVDFILELHPVLLHKKWRFVPVDVNLKSSAPYW